MPKRILPLTDAQVKNVKSKEKPYKISDGLGLHLLVTPTGGKLWRYQYRFGGKQKLLSFGAYPAISLGDARKRRNDAKQALVNGNDPSEVKKALKAAKIGETESTFEAVTREWHARFKSQWSENHGQRLLKRLELDAFPFIGQRQIKDLNAREMLVVLRRVEPRTLETAHRLRIACGQIFRYAVATGRAEHDPIADLRGALPPVKFKHMAAPTDPKDVAPLLRAIDGFTGSFVVKCAMQLAPILFVRPGELRHAEWTEIDLELAELRIPLMATGDSEVKPTGIPLGSRPVFRCDGDRQMMRLRGVNVTVS